MTSDPALSSQQEQFAHRDPYHLGFGLTHPIALEGALKLKEITRPAAHCEGIRTPRSSSEFKHGPLRPAAVHDGYPVIFITAPGDEAMTINPVLRNRNKVTTRGGPGAATPLPSPVLSVAEGPPRTRHCAPTCTTTCGVVIPEADRFVSPILPTLPAQLISYHMTVCRARGVDPDFPRNLSKTLTVD
jgi:glucosamine--fructose-6-phosphate aminotransferase (isomerizing)